MASQGATLQTLNNEMVSCLEGLKSKREEVWRQLQVDDEEKKRIQNDLHILTERLGRVTEGLARKQASLEDIDRTIHDTEGAYSKILESSQTLLEFMRREAVQVPRR